MLVIMKIEINGSDNVLQISAPLGSFFLFISTYHMKFLERPIKNIDWKRKN